MSVLLILVAGAAFLALGGLWYAPWIGRVLGERADRPTPATRVNDGRDYVPTPTPVVFAHHYASIAGAGPIVGPILAIYFGWLPALIWILVGGVLLGAVHDYVATHIAVREGGKNLAIVTRRYIGVPAFLMMLVMLVALLVLVCAAFLDLSATALTSRVPVQHLQLSVAQRLFQVENGEALIGGIASTSVVVITAFSPLIGFLYLKRKTPVWVCSLLAIGVCILSIIIGVYLPMRVEPQTWKGLISAYVLVSAGLPVWLFLQSRDFVNVHMLYLGLAFVAVALIAAALRGGGQFANATEAMPALNMGEASAKLGPMWPILFITIACGAVSGFHSLCAGGTTCKQLRNELGARRVGYYAMLLESFLALCVVCCVLVGLTLVNYRSFCYPAGGRDNPILTFAMSVGHTAQAGLGLPVSYGALGAMLLLEGFLVTTLDTAIRLTRYMIEEGWAVIFGRYDVFAEDAARQRVAIASVDAAGRGATEITGAGGLTIDRPSLSDVPLGRTLPTRGVARHLLRTLKHYWINSGIAVGLMLLLGWGKGFTVLWQIFGSANQLLAALTLIVASTWLLSKARPVWYTLLPALFMLATSVCSLARLLIVDFIPNWRGKGPLAVTAVLVILMTIGILVTTAQRWTRRAVPGGAAPARG